MAGSAAEVVHHGQRPNAPAVEQCVGDEVSSFSFIALTTGRSGGVPPSLGAAAE